MSCIWKMRVHRNDKKNGITIHTHTCIQRLSVWNLVHLFVASMFLVSYGDYLLANTFWSITLCNQRYSQSRHCEEVPLPWMLLVMLNVAVLLLYCVPSSHFTSVRFTFFSLSPRCHCFVCFFFLLYLYVHCRRHSYSQCCPEIFAIE